MSTTVNVYQKTGERVIMPLDDRRGTYGMLLVVATEAALFATLFCVYFINGNNKDRWKIDQPPHLTYPFIMLGVMIVSVLLLLWGGRCVRQSHITAARTALGLVIVCALVFLALQSVSYIDSWKRLAPYSDSYGSIFYTITIFHDAHVIIGIFILFCALFLPGYRVAVKAPYRPYRVAAIYWYFCAAIYFIVLVILFVIPNAVVYGL